MLGWLFGFDTTIQDTSTTDNSQTENTSDSYNYHPLSLHRTLDDIVVAGDIEFVRFVGECLSKVAQHGQFNGVVSQLKEIRQVTSWSSAGMGCDGVFTVNLDALGYSENDFFWGASQIIHDATHFQRMQDRTFDWNNPVNEELIAFRPQEQFLRDCGACYQAEYVAVLDGRHCLR